MGRKGSYVSLAFGIENTNLFAINTINEYMYKYANSNLRLGWGEPQFADHRKIIGENSNLLYALNFNAFIVCGNFGDNVNTYFNIQVILWEIHYIKYCFYNSTYYFYIK